jgi:hypothetical protein
VAQALRPFPQFGTISNVWSPLGKTWYDALQLKTTKRFSHGLDFTSTFSWQKELVVGVGGTATTSVINNPFDYNSNKYTSPTSRPLSLVFAGNYQLPALHTNSIVSWLLRDWRIGAVMQYASGLPIRAPQAQTRLNDVISPGATLADAVTSYAVRKPGEPLYTVDLNCHCYDPLKTSELERMDRSATGTVRQRRRLLLTTTANSGAQVNR